MGSTNRDIVYRELERRGIPGPGTYQTIQSIMYGPKYRLEFSFNNIKFSFGVVERKIFKVNKNPGPGEYTIPCSFTIVPRKIVI